MEDGLFMVSNDVDVTEMFILHDGFDRDIKCFVSHPDVENDDEEELGWEKVPPSFEHDEEEELGGARNDSDGACNGLRDSSSSDGDDIEDVVNQGHEGPLTVKKAVDGLEKCVMIFEHDEESDCSDDNCSVVSSSDEEEGLTEFMDLLFPGVEYRCCMRHYYSNFQKVHKGKELNDLMWGAASAYTLLEDQAKMRELRAVSMEAHNWLIHEPPKNWVMTREASPYPLIPTGRKDESNGVRRGRGTGREVPRGRGLSRGRGVAIGGFQLAVVKEWQEE
ncbi:hypothetical protein RHMOL_Rhmol10G0225400 [Rhododendron molle]|uniref:Uncharacterized protein n=1 Tax=Rhododendron molle TaxID=49168 RepID=A0ACC0M657_RHOML|nr:hypothetical protein RHMOL_Rhmol10G0225400 [Rhododendron molle]